MIEEELYVLEEKEDISDRKAKIESKNTFMGKYYAYLLHKGPMKGLLIAGAILGLIVSVYLMVGGGFSWWWIPLSIMFIGPIGLVFFALILPFIPYILYGILIIIIEMMS
ncbi:MAG: hypothetical protein E3J90_02100 [Promethearchaeota archaeon]|nr:MAG: hypothetical protein E3J90_02100 [Candidatus Lokiarchaeota archaeon]